LDKKWLHTERCCHIMWTLINKPDQLQSSTVQWHSYASI